MKVQPNSAQVDELNNYIDGILWEYCLLNTANVRKQILSHLDLALIAPFNYSDNTPIYVAFQRKGEWCGVIPLSEVLKKEEE